MEPAQAAVISPSSLSGRALEELACIHDFIRLGNNAKSGNPLLDSPGFSSSMLSPERLGILAHERREQTRIRFPRQIHRLSQIFLGLSPIALTSLHSRTQAQEFQMVCGRGVRRVIDGDE